MHFAWSAGSSQTGSIGHRGRGAGRSDGRRGRWPAPSAGTGAASPAGALLEVASSAIALAMSSIELSRSVIASSYRAVMAARSSA